MKNVKLGFFALLGLTGAASAFTTAPKHLTGTTYYALTNGAGSFTWVTTQPVSPIQCQSVTSSLPYCTIVTQGDAPVNGQAPPASAILISAQKTLYKHI